MRIETSGLAYFICLILLLLVWMLRNNAHSKPFYIFMLSFCGALLLPAFVPGHGEIIVILPNATLFTLFNSSALGMGVFYFVINFFISYAVLNIIQKYKNLNQG